MTPTPNTTGPESIVVSLENAKKLKEAGWPQDEMSFYWNRCDEEYWLLFDRVLVKSEESCAAPTAEEILRRLPDSLNMPLIDGVSHNHEQRELQIGKGLPSEWAICYMGTEGHHSEYGSSLANAAAAMYCHLAQQGLLPKA